MASSLSSFASEGIHKIKSNDGYSDKKYEICRIKYKNCDRFLEDTNFKDNLIEYKYLYCNKNYQQKFHEKLKEQCFNTCKYSNNNNRILMLQKCVFP